MEEVESKQIVCAGSNPSDQELMDAYNLAVEKGFTSYSVLYYPGAICVISFEPPSYQTPSPVSNILDTLRNRVLACKVAINNAYQSISCIEHFLDFVERESREDV